MSDKKISELPSTDHVNAEDLFAIVQDGVTVSVSADHVGGGGSLTTAGCLLYDDAGVPADALGTQYQDAGATVSLTAQNDGDMPLRLTLFDSRGLQIAGQIKNGVGVVWQHTVYIDSGEHIIDMYAPQADDTFYIRTRLMGNGSIDAMTITAARSRGFVVGSDDVHPFKLRWNLSTCTILDETGWNFLVPVSSNDPSRVPLQVVAYLGASVNVHEVYDNSGFLAWAIGPEGEIQTSQGVGGVSTLGTVIGSLPIYDATGTLLGYVPIYDSIS